LPPTHRAREDFDVVSSQLLTRSHEPEDGARLTPSRGRLTRRHLVVALALLWLVDGALQFQPDMYSRSSNSFLATVLSYNTMGRPNLLTELIRFAVLSTYGTAGRQVVFNTLAAVVQLGIGVGLIWRRTERLALAFSFAWALFPWVVGEGLGQMPWPQASMAVQGSPGAAALYMILALVLWPRRTEPPRAGHCVADGGLLRGRGTRAVWAVVWAGTGALELEHANWASDALSAEIRNNAAGEPSWLAHLDRSVSRLLYGHGTEVVLVVLVVQVVVALWVLRPMTRRAGLALGIAVSLVYWVIGQNFGGILTGTATDPNLGPVMVLLALALWPRSTPSGGTEAEVATPVAAELGSDRPSAREALSTVPTRSSLHPAIPA
jgi:hypothetical protein